MPKVTCPSCGREFMPWRGKKFCSERCAAADRKRRQRAMSRDETAVGYGSSGEGKNAPLETAGNLDFEGGVSRDGGSFDRLFWKAVNEVTQKCSEKEGGVAVGWTMLIAGHGWFGRVRDKRGEWSFGPSTTPRCRNAVEAWLRHEAFDKHEDEHMWRGTCGDLVTLR